LTADYTVQLDRVFNGPMDLLLHLVRTQEVEIHEISISLVVDGFLAYLEELDKLDLEFASDFVLMAATLMAIKSRRLLPRDEVDLEEELDPGDELIQQLIEYRRVKESSQALEERMRARASLHIRGWRGEVNSHREGPELDLSELDAWDLLATWSRLLRETQADRPHHITAGERPLRWYVERMVGQLAGSECTSLRTLLDGVPEGLNRETLVGSFCAVLELCKLGLVTIQQEGSGADIEIQRSFADVAEAERVLADLESLEEKPNGTPGAPQASGQGPEGEVA